MLLRFLILLFLFLNLNAVTFAAEQKIFKNITTENILNNFFSNSKLVGQATYKFLLLSIYEAKLISETGKFPAEKFALTSISQDIQAHEVTLRVGGDRI